MIGSVRRAALLLLFMTGVARAEPGKSADPGDSSLTTAEWHDGASRISDAPDTEPVVEKTAKDLHPVRRLYPIFVSIEPGIFVHGAGHAAAGKPKTAEHLLIAEGVGFGTLLVGTGGLALTGASRYTVAPFALLMIGGGSLFAVSWAADVYGVTVSESDRGTALVAAPRLESAIGIRAVHDPQFRYRNFLVESFDLRLGRLRLAPSAWFALDDDNARERLLAAWRLSGPLPSAEPAVDGSFVDVEVAGTSHRYVSDGFETKTGEVSVNARFDLTRFDSGLRGTFAEGGVGFGLQRIEYDIPGTGVPADLEQLLLARAAFGAYLGRGNGEVSLYYDHRHDDFAAGLQLTGLGSGVLGHFGVDARYFTDSGLGIIGDAQIGSAYLFGASLAFRQGGR